MRFYSILLCGVFLTACSDEKPAGPSRSEQNYEGGVHEECLSPHWSIPNLKVGHEVPYFDKCIARSQAAAKKELADRASDKFVADFKNRNGRFGLSARELTHENGFPSLSNENQDFVSDQRGVLLLRKEAIGSVTVSATETVPIAQVIPGSLHAFLPLFDIVAPLGSLQKFERQVFLKAVELKRQHPKTEPNSPLLRACAMYRTAEEIFAREGLSVSVIHTIPPGKKITEYGVVIDHDFPYGRTGMHCPFGHLLQSVVGLAHAKSNFKEAYEKLDTEPFPDMGAAAVDSRRQSSGLGDNSYWAYIMENHSYWIAKATCFFAQNLTPVLSVPVSDAQLARAMQAQNSIDGLCGLLPTGGACEERTSE